MKTLKYLLLSVFLLIQTGNAWSKTTIPEGGKCGSNAIDLVIMLDRTGSVHYTEREFEAAAAKSLLDTFISLNGGHKVAIGAFNKDGAGEPYSAEIVAGLSTNYTSLKNSVTSAMDHASSATNVEAAVTISRNELVNNGTNGQKYIVLISDGQTLDRTTSSITGTTCNGAAGTPVFTDANDCAAYKAAESAKNEGIKIITIAYDTSGSSKTETDGRTLLAAIASPVSATEPSDDDSQNVGASATAAEITAENNDSDNFYISPTTSQLTGIFNQVGGNILCYDGDPCTRDVCSQNNTCTYPAIDDDNDGQSNCKDLCPLDPNKTKPGQCGCGAPDTDRDADGSADCVDNCDEDATKTEPGLCGCGVADTDTDRDGTADCQDACINDATKVVPGVCGCGIPDTDSDRDGTPNCNDQCPDDPNKIAQGTCGCGVADTDSDQDGYADCVDECPQDSNKVSSGQCGCGIADTDTDADGVADCNDQCADEPGKTVPGQCGCGLPDIDTDQDQTLDCNDGCPNDPAKIAVGQCGCGIADTDSDQDGTADCNDSCVNDPLKTSPGTCGCGVADTDSDQDGTADCNDMCVNDPYKTQPGQCGCGVADSDSDQDGIADCTDLCPTDPAKTNPGVCGCNNAETDSDKDGTLNCVDECPDDASKVNPGICGCGVADIDTDGDNIADCRDDCPADINKASPGQCGCGIADTDSDNDGVADCNDVCATDSAKSSDAGICGCNVADVDSDDDNVADCNDDCPADPSKIEAGICGCGVSDVDTDQDGVASCLDSCPNDPDKSSPGACGCGTPDTDSDDDGVANCNDQCTLDPAKSEPGICGCGFSDVDSDENGVADCIDRDEEVPCTDTDQDGICDSVDNCVNISNPDQVDSDEDGIGDACDATPQAAVPPGGVGVAGGRNCALTPGGNAMNADFSLAYFILMTLGGLVVLRLRKNRAWMRSLMSLTVSVLILSLAITPAWALNTQKWRPSTGQTAGQAVYTSEVLPKYHFVAGLNANLANHPFEQVNLNGTSRLNGIVDRFITADFLLSYGATNWLTLNVDVPLNAYHNIAPTFIPARDTGGGDLGDIMVSAQIQAWDANKTQSGLGLAFVPFMTFPSGDEDIYFGESNITGGLIVAGDWKFWDNRIALNAGVKFRESETISNLTVDHELMYGLSYQRPLVKDWDLDFIVEAFGSTNLNDNFATQDISSPLEGDLTLRKKWGENKRLVTDIGGGAGISNGYGLPNYRIFAGISYAWDLSPDAPKPRRVRIEIPSEVLFDFDKFNIKDSANPILDKVATEFSKSTTARLTIEGHTDSIGSDAYNDALSKKRANSIRTYLIGRSIAADRLTAVGYGETQPVASNDTAEGRQKNRRAVFQIDND